MGDAAAAASTPVPDDGDMEEEQGDEDIQQRRNKLIQRGREFYQANHQKYEELRTEHAKFPSEEQFFGLLGEYLERQEKLLEVEHGGVYPAPRDAGAYQGTLRQPATVRGPSPNERQTQSLDEMFNRLGLSPLYMETRPILTQPILQLIIRGYTHLRELTTPEFLGREPDVDKLVKGLQVCETEGEVLTYQLKGRYKCQAMRNFGEAIQAYAEVKGNSWLEAIALVHGAHPDSERGKEILHENLQYMMGVAGEYDMQNLHSRG